MTQRIAWRIGFAVVWAAAMLAVGLTTYSVLGSRKSHSRAPVVTAPHTTVPAFNLPGAIYLAHHGGLYRMQDGLFTELQKQTTWSQPAIAPDGSRLVAVQRTELNYSDLYLLDPGNGQVTTQLTRNRNTFVVEYNLWSFYPRFSADGGSIFYSTDRGKDGSYRVDLAIWQLSAAQPQNRPVQWTDPNEHTGGDVSPVPLKDGGLIYAKYAVSDQGQSYSQLWLTRRPRDAGKALTDPAASCAQPAISPDQSQVAMICSADKRTANLVVAPFDGNALGTPRTLVSGELVSAPTWAPDGSGLIYLASAGSSAVGNFQLWWLALPSPAPAAAPTVPPAAAPTGTSPAAGPSPTPTPPPKPRQVTTRLDFDGLSPPVWVK
jgi:hypothetical protein